LQVGLSEEMVILGLGALSGGAEEEQHVQVHADGEPAPGPGANRCVSR
jgi:hypothetical protein